MCDNSPDCLYSEDESTNCDYNQRKLFLCHSLNESISYKKVCDFFPDCPDGSDEMFCSNLTLFFKYTQT